MSTQVLLQFLSVLGLMLMAVPALALQPPAPGELERLRQEGRLTERVHEAKALGNHLIKPELLARANWQAAQLQNQALGLPEMSEAMAPPPAWRGMPTSGKVKVLALCIDFPDAPHRTDAATIASKLFGNGSAGDLPVDSLRNYYLRSSYGKLEIEGTVLGWYRSTKARTEIAAMNASSGLYSPRQELIKEALSYYNAQGHDFSVYDNNNDGEIDYLLVFWAGAQGAWASFWWGYQTSFYDGSYRLDGKSLGTYSWQWETYFYGGTSWAAFSPQTAIHETGHALGLPDYYDYDSGQGPKGGIGGLDMMDANWGDHNAFSKFVLDWLTPQVLAKGRRTVTLRPLSEQPEALIVFPKAGSGPFGEYFLVQNRWRTQNDLHLPTDGLTIWHVDARLDVYGADYLFNNSYTAHKLLRLMEADGLEQIETSSAYSHAADYYLPGKNFGPATTPGSKAYDGNATQVSVSAITNDTASRTVTFSAYSGAAAAAPSSVMLLNNPF